MLRFRNRVALLDVRADEFLSTLVQLGGYCTVGQAKRFGIANSDTRALAQLRTFDESGFLRKVAAYPVVYQATKSATRLRAADRRARRLHSPKTVLNRLLAIDFYLDACSWPAEFVFDHEMKIQTFTQHGCPLNAIPHRGGRPYLWEEFLLHVGDGSIAIALVDDQQRSPFSQSTKLAKRFAPTLRFLPPHSNLLIITGSNARQRIYEHVLRHPDLRRTQAGAPILVEPYQIEPSTKFFAQSDPATSHRHERTPTGGRPRFPVWATNLASIR